MSGGEQAYEPVPLELGGQPRTMRATLRAFREIRRFALDHPEADTLDSLGPMVRALLAHEDQTVTVEQVEEWIDLANINAVKDAVNRALGRDVFAAAEAPDAEAGGEEANPFDPSTSEPSGQRLAATV